jgi:prevent-host-death family protein
MVSINITDALNNFAALIDRSGERIRIEQHGKAVAAIVSAEDLERLEALEDAIDSATLKRAMAESAGLVAIEELLAIRPIEE